MRIQYLAWLVLFPLGASATTVWTDRGAFEQAVGSFRVLELPAMEVPGEGGVLDLGAISFEAPGHESRIGVIPEGNLVGDVHYGCQLEETRCPQWNAIAYEGDAFGFDLLWAEGRGLILEADDTTTSLQEGFIGWTGSPSRRVRIRSAGEEVGYVIANATIATPEPSSAWLFSLGLVAIRARARGTSARRSRRSASSGRRGGRP